MGALLLGRVRLVDPIGSGGSGTVWRAWDRRSRRYVAAKIGVRDTCDHRVALTRPHLLTATEWLDHDVTSLALLPLVRGGSAERLLAEHGTLPTSYVALLLEQLLAAVAALHAAGLVHRDVKPANLLLDPTRGGPPYLWLSDLGVAAPIGEATTLAGTTGFLAPDVVPGVPAMPHQDLYAAGVTAAVLLTGRVPSRERDLPRGPLRGLLRDLTAADPRRRPASADEARDRVALLVEGPTQGWPVVPDRLRRLSLLERWRVQGMRAAQ